MEHGPLRAALKAELDGAVDEAHRAATDAAADPAEAVQRSRRALRRARVVLALFAHATKKREARAMREALGKARHTLSPIHDAASAPKILERLMLSDDEREAARRAITALAAGTHANNLQEHLHEATAAIRVVASAFPDELAWEDVSRGVRTIYADARYAHRKSSRRWFLAWHRRTKELVQALGLVTAYAGPRLSAIHAEYAGLIDVMRPPVDLITMREVVKTVAESTAALETLREHLDELSAELAKDMRKAARDAFHAKPKKFERRLDKAVGRDLASPDDERNA